MRQRGTIVRWDAVKGFGFIRSATVSQDVFVHVHDLNLHGGDVPRQGLRVTFDTIHVGGKGPRAVAVESAVADAAGVRREVMQSATSSRRSPVRSARRPPPAGAGWVLPLMVVYGVGLAWLVWQRQAPWWILPASILLNLATFFAYWQDKHAAQTGRWRIREDTLHMWSLAGGWGGAWVAQQVLRHKSVKPGFRAAHASTVVMHCAAVVAAWWFLRTG